MRYPRSGKVASIDWDQTLRLAERFNEFSGIDNECAGHWDRCMIGERAAKLDVDLSQSLGMIAVMLTDHAKNLGDEAMKAVSHGDVSRAREIYDEIRTLTHEEMFIPEFYCFLKDDERARHEPK